MSPLVRDLAAAWRRLKRSPTYAFAAVATLGVTLSALTTMGAVVEAVLLRPLPFRNPARLVALWEAATANGRDMSRLAAANFFDLRAQRQLFERAALFGAESRRLTGNGDPEQIHGARVQPDYFRVLGVPPALGRAFDEADARPGAPPVVILGNALFRRRFGGRAEILGQPIVLDGAPCTVVGVMPPALYPTWPLTSGGLNTLPEYQQFWVPLTLDAAWSSNRRTHIFGALARLRPGVTLDRARAGLGPLAARLAREYPATNGNSRFRIVPLAEEFSGSSRDLLLALAAAAALTAALAAANLTGLSLSRALDRRAETAIRLWLGAPHGALAREAFVEAAVVALGGAALGLLLARVELPLLASLLPVEIPRLAEARVGFQVALATAVAALLCAGVLGGALAFGASGGAASSGLRLEQATARDRLGHRRTLHRGLVVAQVALSVALLSVAGLFARSILALGRVETGFVAGGVVTAAVSLPPSEYGAWDRVVELDRALVAAVGARPEVAAAAVAYDSPLESTWIDAFRLLDGGRAEDAAGSVSAHLNIVSPDFFRAVGLRLERGRAFETADERAHPGAAVVSESFARRFFPGESAIGHRLEALTPSRMWAGSGAATEFRIVGIAGDVRNQGIDREGAPTVYLPAAQFPQQEMTLIVRTRREPLSLAPDLRHMVAALDPSLPLGRVDTLVAALDRQVAKPRFALLVVGVFGTVAVLLAGLGIYGLLALVTGYRRHEIAVRMAVGARPADIAGEVLGQASRLAAAGAVLGITCGSLCGRALQHLFFGVQAADPAVAAGAALILVLTALAAALGPMRRAVTVDPAHTLRN
ncbi:MAG TPA: ADOP family duplicated permease [Thermoanaerobaculia bacterium]|nr:ADOP family duplicated permease [Thermoanaerobaculia bacterium]